MGIYFIKVFRGRLPGTISAKMAVIPPPPLAASTKSGKTERLRLNQRCTPSSFLHSNSGPARILNDPGEGRPRILQRLLAPGRAGC